MEHRKSYQTGFNLGIIYFRNRTIDSMNIHGNSQKYMLN